MINYCLPLDQLIASLLFRARDKLCSVFGNQEGVTKASKHVGRSEPQVEKKKKKKKEKKERRKGGRSVATITHLGRGRTSNQRRWRSILGTRSRFFFLRCRPCLFCKVSQSGGKTPAILLTTRTRPRGMTLR